MSAYSSLYLSNTPIAGHIIPDDNKGYFAKNLVPVFGYHYSLRKIFVCINQMMMNILFTSYKLAE